MGNVSLNAYSPDAQSVQGITPQNIVGSGKFEYNSWANGKYTDANEIITDEHIFIANVKNLPTVLHGNPFGFLDVKTYSGWSFSPTAAKRIILQTFTQCDGEIYQNSRYTRCSYDGGETWSNWAPENSELLTPLITNATGGTGLLGFSVNSIVSVKDFFRKLSTLYSTHSLDKTNAADDYGVATIYIPWSVASHFQLSDDHGNMIHIDGGFAQGYIGNPDNDWGWGCLTYTSQHADEVNGGMSATYRISFRNTGTPVNYHDFIEPISNAYASLQNLFDNPNFSINQDGLSEYNTAVTTSNYAMDRWKGSTTNPVLVKYLTDGVINITASNDAGYFYQPLERIMLNSELSMTVYCKGSGTIEFGQFASSGAYYRTVALSDTWTAYRFTWMRINAPYGTSEAPSTDIGIRLVSASTSVDIAWVKLEYGKPTAYIPPNEQAEILKCQRHYSVPYSSLNPNGLNPRGLNIALTKEEFLRIVNGPGGFYTINEHFPTPMRIKPSVRWCGITNPNGTPGEILYDHPADWTNGAAVSGITIIGYKPDKTGMAYLRMVSNYDNESDIPAMLYISCSYYADARA